MILTSIFCALDDPTLIISLFSKTLNNLACEAIGNSPISSKNIVPPFAASKYPFLLSCAPVNDPFSCPKSSESIVPSGIAPQFTAI